MRFLLFPSESRYYVMYGKISSEVHEFALVTDLRKQAPQIILSLELWKKHR